MQQTIFNNRYRLDAIVGEGGMAVVYRGYDLILRRQIAVKVLRDRFASDQAFVRRFYQEAEAAANLSHPNIVNTYDVGEFEGKPYIVQEFVQGETLATLIAREKKLPEAAAVRYARQICSALVAAHRAQLLHRDVKPSNILITPEDVVRVTDFGIAQFSGRQADGESDEILGSVPYCPPEQVSDGDASEASDLYSVGVVLYEMVTGKRPFDADTAAGVAAAHLSAPVPDPATVPGIVVSPELRAVTRRLLQKSPRDRYQSAGEALAALRRCAADESSRSDDSVAAGPDTPTVLLKRRSIAAAPAARNRAGDVFEPAVGRWRVGRATLIAGAIVALAVVLALLFAQTQAVSRSLVVPDLSGKPVPDAVIQLQTLGLDVAAVRLRPDTAVDPGLVDGSEPASSARIDRGRKVTLYVSSGPPTIIVPDVVGQDLKTAMDALTSSGFDVTVGSSLHSNSVRAGSVAQTRPAAGSRVAVHGSIVLLPSAGPLMVTVPNVVALADNDARAQLARLGLKMRVNQVIQDANIPAHMIIDQDPADGTPLAPGQTVTVDVSGGAANIAVPDVVGGTIDDARGALGQAGLTVGSIAQAMLSDTTPGTVVSQNPPAGAQVAQGQPVDLVLAAAPGGETAAPQAGATPAGPQAALPPVPNLIGMTVDQARALLLRSGYAVGRVTMLPGSPPNARIVGTQPIPGATPAPGSNTVDLELGP